jgi:rhamnogalacturonyl hydrolase YesR
MKSFEQNNPGSSNISRRDVLKKIGTLGVAALMSPIFGNEVYEQKITKNEIISVRKKIAERLNEQKVVGRNWEDAPLLDGEIPLGKDFQERARLAIGEGYPEITHGDYAGYATASLDLFQLSPDAELREKMLRTTDGPLVFATHAIRGTPENSPPADNWWVEGGYGMRYWVDDLFTIPPWLAMLSSKENGLPGNQEAGDMAREMISNYVNLLWDKEKGLFWHDASSVNTNSYWGRGNGWAAYGLTRAADYLDTPYGGKYEKVIDQVGIRELLTKMADSLRSLRTPDGGWPTDLLNPEHKEAETSATGLITFMLAKGVNEDWLDKEIYLPVIFKAFDFLLSKVDSNGDISGIQPPGTGPDDYTVSSDNPDVNVNYGVGAVLLAADEIIKFEDEDFSRPKHPRRIINEEIIP